MSNVVMNVLDSGTEVLFSIKRLIAAGWTGRNRNEVLKHVDELKSLGVRPPSSIPMFYEVSPDLVTQDGFVDDFDKKSSGEVEFFLFNLGGEIFVGVGSDHTDRRLESFSVNYSKQVCRKPVSKGCWRLKEVESCWDEIIILSKVSEVTGEETVYQSGRLSQLISPVELMRKIPGGFRDGDMVFGGTVPVIGDIRYSESFSGWLVDPRNNASIVVSYKCRSIDLQE
ncbi:MAG: DUF2848 family protein [Lautropia sp.]|nr:DUF2848 family protein [Lautropia sp.]